MARKLLAVLLVTLTLVGTNSAWHIQDDDHDTPVAHDHSAHHARFRGQAPAATPPQHCAFCHWLTALRIASPARVTAALPIIGVERLPFVTVPRTATVDLFLISPRPPPG